MSDEQSWEQRVAGAIQTVAENATEPQDCEVIYDMVLAALEASGEMKTVKLKVALARCYECFRQQQMEDKGKTAISLPSDQLVDSLYELFQ